MARSLRRFWYWSVLVYLTACIPIEDTFEPNINNLIVAPEFAVDDTLRAVAVLTDNFALREAIVRITQISGESESPWSVRDTLSLEGRRFEFEYQTVIPLDAVVGTYDINVEVFDEGGNNTFLRGSFLVTEDTRGPVIIEPLRLIEPADEPFRFINGRAVVCRQDILQLAGKAADNIGIERVSVQPNNLPGISRIITPPVDTLDLEGVFGNDLRIPVSVQNGTEIDLVVRVTDVEGNDVPDTLRVLVSCDDTPPTIDTLGFTPAADSLGVVRVLEGETFEISTLTVSDNAALERLFILFNPATPTATPDTSYNIALNNFQIADIAYLRQQLSGQPIEFQLPDEAEFGDEYEVFVFVTDTSGNASIPKTTSVFVQNDVAPRITIAEVRSEGALLESDTTTGSAALPFQLAARDPFTIQGKITDDRALRSIDVRWGVEGSEATILSLDEAALNGATVFDFEDDRFPSEDLRIPQDANAGTRFRLLITATDDRDATTRRILNFIVVEE